MRLYKEFNVRTLPHFAEFYLSNSHTRSEVTLDGFARRIVPTTQWPGDDAYAHLKFALRYEGLHLSALRAIVPRLDPTALAARIRAEPTSAYSRRLWFLYEILTGTALDIPDSFVGNYVPLAGPDDYYTGPSAAAPDIASP